MKKIYKSLIALAAALLLVPAAFAQTEIPVQYQHEKYLKNDKGTIGYNKYLVSNTPDANGYYTLRIENFVTGTIDSYAVPTDFVLVLDVSGSMLCDHRLRGQQVPIAIKKSVNDAKDDSDVSKLRLDDGCGRGYTHYAYTSYYNKGEAGSEYPSGTASSGIAWLGSATNAPTNNGAVGNSNRWFLYGDTYYRIFKNSSNGNRYVYFDLVDDNGNRILVDGQPQRKYLKQEGDDIVVTETMPTGFTTDKTILLVDNRNDSGYKLYRYANRKDALLKGVNSFMDMILEHNQQDEVWEEGVTRHQVAVVAFGSCSSQNISLNGGTTNTRVAKVFAEINDANLSNYKNWDSGLAWNAGTDVGRGVETGRRLFEKLAEDPAMRPLTASGGANRNKVMIVFTDGEPNSYSTSNSSTGYLNSGGHCAYSIEQGNIVKKTGKIDATKDLDAEPNNQQINGLVYTINLSNNNTYVPAFLQHLSSDYPQATSSVEKGQNTSASASQFGGTIGEKTGYYMDATEMNDLSDAFGSIASAATGETKQMVAVDVMSDDFVIPFTTAETGRVKIYTAQCIGKKEIDGEEYLAFAREVPAPSRNSLDHLWVRRVEGEGDAATVNWIDLAPVGDGIDIDNQIKFTVSSDSKKIILSGFNYPDMFCGLDPDPDHNNNTRQIEADDPNFAYQKDGYRGFKMIFEFPIALDPDALGGVNVPTNDVGASGLFFSDENGNPIGDPEVNYPTPDLPVPVKLIIQKTGLKPGESANFTVQRKRREGNTAAWEDFTTFVLTGDATKTPEVRIINLDPAYYYKVKESNWSWAYEGVSQEYSTETTGAKNPIVFKNNPIPDTPKHAEAKADNKLKSW